MVDGAEQLGHAESSARRLDADRALRHGGQHLVRRDRRGDAMSAAPAASGRRSASSVASATPLLELARRVSTLPRKDTTARSGRRCRTCAWRRSDDVPTTAPFGRSASAARPCRLMKASRTSSRGRNAGRPPGPSGSMVGMSFMECTARSIVAGEQRLLDLLGEQALAADLGERPVLDAVAGGLDDARSRNRRGRARAPPPAARAPRAPGPAPAASRACRSGPWKLATGNLSMLRGADSRRCPAFMPLPEAPAQTPPCRCDQPTGAMPRGRLPTSLVLGIETSCDETAAAVVARAADGERADPVQRRARAVGAAPPLRRRGAGDRRARACGVPRRDRRAGHARGRRRVRRARCGRGDGGPGPDRRAAGRRDDGQGHRPGARPRPSSPSIISKRMR